MSKRQRSSVLDPRTQLPLIEVPPRLATTFSELQSCVVHWMEVVRRVDVSGKESNTVMVLGDAAVYVCDLTGGIKRCVLIKDVEVVFLREGDDSMGLHLVEGTNDFDLLIRFETSADVVAQGGREADTVAAYIQRIYWVHMGREVERRELHAADPIEPHLLLQKPPKWTLRVEPLRTRKFLEKLIRDQQSVEQREDEKVAEEFIRIKAMLERDLQQQRNVQYDKMVTQNLKLLDEVGRKDSEIARLKAILDRLAPNLVAQATDVVDGSSPRSSKASKKAAAAAKKNTTAESGSREGGKCENCTQLMKLLDEHPNTDKKRVLAAEEQLRDAKREIQQLHIQTLPDKEEIEALRSCVSRVDGVLREQFVSLPERVRGVLHVIKPFAIPAESGAAGKIGAPPSSDVEQLQEEVEVLKGILCDATRLHMSEMRKLRDEFQAYDAHMIDAVHAALLGHVPDRMNETSKGIVQEAKAALQRGGGSPAGRRSGSPAGGLRRGLSSSPRGAGGGLRKAGSPPRAAAGGFGVLTPQQRMQVASSSIRNEAFQRMSPPRQMMSFADLQTTHAPASPASGGGSYLGDGAGMVATPRAARPQSGGTPGSRPGATTSVRWVYGP